MGSYYQTLVYTIIAVGPLFVCVSVCLWLNSSETSDRINFVFGTNVKHTPGIVQIFFGDHISKVKVMTFGVFE